MIIEKITFYEYINRKGINIANNCYNRAQCYLDYTSIDRN